MSFVFVILGGKFNFLPGKDGLVVWMGSYLLILIGNYISYGLMYTDCFSIFFRFFFCSYGKMTPELGALEHLKYPVKERPRRGPVLAHADVSHWAPCLRWVLVSLLSLSTSKILQPRVSG